MSVPHALLCPGQGSQHPGMFDRVRDDPAAAPALAAREGNGAGMDPFANAAAQPAVVACALAHAAALTARADGLPPPTVLLGYSVGELAAAALAGCFPDPAVAVRLAGARAAAMDSAASVGAPGGGLLAVRGLPDDALDALARDAGLVTAIFNGPGHRVLGGPPDALTLGEHLARVRGAATVRRLPVTVPAHTPALAPAAAPFRAALLAAGPRAPAPGTTFLAGIDAAPVRDVPRLVDTLSAQLHRPILWERCLLAAWERGARVFLELPPGDALSRMARDVLPGGAGVRAVEEFHTLDGAAAWLRRATGAG